MATAALTSCMADIGETAGSVWNILAENESLSMTKLIKAVGKPHDAVMQALGWLARENKILIEEKGRSRIVSLR